MSKDMVLIVTASDEPSIADVVTHMTTIGQQYVRLDTDQFLVDGVKILLRLSGHNFGGVIKLKDKQEVALDSIKSVWFRRPKSVSAGNLYKTTDEITFVEKEASSALWSLYTNLDRVFWMNHPLSARKMLENNKLLQQKFAVLSGLAIPDTIITNEPVTLFDFCRRHGGSIALKTIGFHVFPKESGMVSGIYTNRVSEDYLRSRLDSITATPIMAQEYIEKKLELRVTIVGRQIFTCAIYSQDSDKTKHDWRHYDFDNVKHEKYLLPPTIEHQLLDFMKLRRLSFGAIDMILTPAGKYVFLEVNPSGQFRWIESLTGMPISRAIAETFSNPNE